MQTAYIADHLLSQLNEEQKRAVTATEGPTLILAGAGTGKTKVITHRLAYLLAAKPDLTPENILALTYTRKAAEEMASRVEELLPKLAAVPKVMTFHAFALELVQEHALALGLAPKTKLLTQILERASVVEPILWDHPLESFSQIPNRGSLVLPFLRFFDRAKDERVTPEELKVFAEAKNETALREIAGIYGAYESALVKNEAIDFGGLVLAAIRLLSGHSQIAKKAAAIYRYILVDEFQDTNIAQIELLRLLAAQHKNICVVGDDDQAIYRFRGASYASFKKFREIFPNANLLKLTQNYRSTENILDTAGTVIRANGKDRYEETKELWTQNPLGPKPALHYFASYDEEALWIAREIGRLSASIRLEEIAILVRAHSHGEKIKLALAREKIPFVESAGTKLFEEEEIRDATSPLNLISEKEEDISLARILLGSFVGIRTAEYRELSEWASKEKKKPLARLLEEAEKSPILSGPSRERLRKFNHSLERLKVRSRRLNVSDLFWEMAIEFKLFAAYLPKGTRAAEQAVRHLGLFYELIHQFEAGDRKKAILAKLMDYLALARDLDLEPDFEEEPQSPPNAVRILTLHAAKGLEFQVVFLASLNDGRFPARSREDLIPFPDALVKEELPAGDFHVEEERRLFYVGLTRAEQSLYLSCVEKSRVKPSIFIREILASEARGLFDIVKHEGKGEILSPEASRRNREESFGATDEEILAFVKKHFIAPQPALAAKPVLAHDRKLTLSHTQIETYEWCPLKYEFSYVWKVPKPESPHLVFGTNMHKALEEFYRGLKDGAKPQCEDLLRLYETHWASRGFKGKMQEENYKKRGREALANYYRTHVHEFDHPPLFLEEPFRVKIQNNLEIIGKIDRVQEMEDGSVEVIDYKTGKPKDQKYADSSLQLSIYALALEQMSGKKVRRLSFYYLEPGEQISTEAGPERILDAQEKIMETARKIRAGEFPPIPESDRFMKCKICEYKPLCPVWER